MAKSKVRTKKKVKRSVTDGVAHVHASFNNTIITITDRQGNALAWTTAGSSGFAARARARPLRHRLPRAGWANRARVRDEELGSVRQGAGTRARVRGQGLEQRGIQDHQHYRRDADTAQWVSAAEEASGLGTGYKLWLGISAQSVSSVDAKAPTFRSRAARARSIRNASSRSHPASTVPHASAGCRTMRCSFVRSRNCVESMASWNASSATTTVRRRGVVARRVRTCSSF